MPKSSKVVTYEIEAKYADGQWYKMWANIASAEEAHRLLSDSSVPDAEYRIIEITHKQTKRVIVPHEKQVCGAPVGIRPYWMGPDQWDQCYCVLTKGHTPSNRHQCSHLVDSEG